MTKEICNAAGELARFSAAFSVELGFFGGGEIPIADNVEIRRNLVDDGTPLPLEIEPGRGPDLPIAAQQPLAFKQW